MASELGGGDIFVNVLGTAITQPLLFVSFQRHGDIVDEQIYKFSTPDYFWIQNVRYVLFLTVHAK
jgi:hypothetical protein